MQCPACHGSRVKGASGAERKQVAGADGFTRIFKCQDCGHVFPVAFSGGMLMMVRVLAIAGIILGVLMLITGFTGNRLFGVIPLACAAVILPVAFKKPGGAK